jgi:glycosyltransferase involved in cell wall biosynthesis
VEDVILPNTSLCAIVRDELDNPAGGILRFLRSVMPHVPEGIVVDTGSKDGTRDALEQAKRNFPHLRVFDLKFEGYAEARNYSLSRARNKRALVLDADEIITQEDYFNLYRQLREYSSDIFNFNFVNIYPDEPNSRTVDCHKARLFDTTHKFKNKNGCWFGEHLEINEIFSTIGIHLKIEILHFKPEMKGESAKRQLWYHGYGGTSRPQIAPSDLNAHFHLMREYNPKRDRYKSSNLDIPSKGL